MGRFRGHSLFRNNWQQLAGSNGDTHYSALLHAINVVTIIHAYQLRS